MGDDVQTIRANGIRFAYLSEGSGPLVMLFHGFPDTAHTWSHVMPLIAAKGCRAVAFFMRGYHPTEVPARDADAETLARDPIALLDAFGETEAILVGHDWGYACAYGAASLAPERINEDRGRGRSAPGGPQTATFAGVGRSALLRIQASWSRQEIRAKRFRSAPSHLQAVVAHTVEEMPGGHFMHREHPEIFAERLLAHL